MCAIGHLGKRSDIDKFLSSWTALTAVKIETVLFKEVYEPLLFDALIKNGDICLTDPQTKGVIENDIKKSLSKAEDV